MSIQVTQDDVQFIKDYGLERTSLGRVVIEATTDKNGKMSESDFEGAMYFLTATLSSEFNIGIVDLLQDKIIDFIQEIAQRVPESSKQSQEQYIDEFIRADLDDTHLAKALKKAHDKGRSLTKYEAIYLTSVDRNRADMTGEENIPKATRYYQIYDRAFHGL